MSEVLHINDADFETAVNNAVYSLKKTDVKPDLLYYDYTI